ncbi:hypothetical protein K501DRAFT_315455 [Backusella circina FSU 941]|nr:hypothetical protein K501DRAFT_315455 [Backusella circina FSU 941]
MDKLPPEILRKIFKLLVLDEKLECTLVCRSWWRALDEFSLFYSVELSYSFDQFNRFINMIQDSPHRAAQVQKLELHNCIPSTFNKRKLHILFPNVRHVVALMTGEQQAKLSEPLELTRTTSKVEYISESVYFEYTYQLISSNLCGRLGFLELNFPVLEADYWTFMPQLRNMPVLKHLVLLYPKLKVTDLETLHRNIPSIQKLELINTSLCSSESPAIITPTTSLKTCSFSTTEYNRLEDLCQFYLYLSKKYISVTKWEHLVFRYHLIGKTRIKQFYENGFLQFLQRIGPTQDALKLHYLRNRMDVFKALDESGSRIKSFYFFYCQGGTLFEYLAKSNQANYVESLFLYDTTTLNSLNHIGSMTALTKLHLCDKRFSPISLTDCLNACPPTLKDFSFSVHHQFTFDRSTTCNIFFIEKLTIRSSKLTSELGDAISLCFPKLVHLCLRGDVLENITIAPQSLHIETVKIETALLRKKHGLSFKSANEPSPQLCLCKKNSIVFTTNESLQTLPMLTFEYFKEQELDISDSEKFDLKKVIFYDIGLAIDSKETQNKFYIDLLDFKHCILVTDFDHNDDTFQYLDVDIVKQGYKNGLVEFLQLIGATRNYLTLSRVPDNSNVFEALDNSNSKINNFRFEDCQGGTLFHVFPQSNQANHVQNQRLLNIEMDLKLEFSGSDYDVVGIDSTSYLNAYSISLEELSVKFPCLRLDLVSTMLTYIVFLKVQCNQLIRELGDILSTYFSKLHLKRMLMLKLKWSKCILTVTVSIESTAAYYSIDLVYYHGKGVDQNYTESLTLVHKGGEVGTRP